MTDEQVQQEQMPEEEAKKPSRRRLIIYGIVGVVVVCILCSVAYNIAFPGDDGGEPATLPEEAPTAVQLPEEGSLPTDTPLPPAIPTEAPTKVPTKIPTEVPTEAPAVEDTEAEYYASVLPGTLVMGFTMQNLSQLFDNPQLDDINWFAEVTSEMSELLELAIELNAIPVPEGCDNCTEINNEFSMVETHATQASEDWIAWLEDPNEVFHLESMAGHIAEIGNAFTRAQAFIEE